MSSHRSGYVILNENRKISLKGFGRVRSNLTSKYNVDMRIELDVLRQIGNMRISISDRLPKMRTGNS